MSRRFDLSRPALFFSRMTDSSRRICATSTGPIRLPSSFEGVRDWCCSFCLHFLEGGQGGCAGREGYDSVCTHSGSDNGDRPHATHCVRGRVQSQVAWAPSQQGRSTQGHRTGSSRQRQSRKPWGDEFGIMEDDRCIDIGIFQRRYLVHELVFACSPPPPPRLQTSHTLVTQADWCADRAVAHCEQGLFPVATILALIGAWNAVLRCTLCTARRPLFEAKVLAGVDRQRSKGRNTGVCAKDGLLAISLSPQQPFPSSPTFGQEVSPGANHAMEKKEVLDGRCTVPLGVQSHSAVRQCLGLP